MNKLQRLILLICILIIVNNAMWGSEPRTRRFAFVAGNNFGHFLEAKLHFAEEDARQFSKILHELGGVQEDDIIDFKTSPKSIKEFEDKLTLFRDRINKYKEEYEHIVAFFYYSGHSSEQGLLINGKTYSFDTLYNQINTLSANLKIVILDSCYSGKIIKDDENKAKALSRKLPGFMFDENAFSEGQVYIASSAPDQESYESKEFMAGYFSYNFFTALQGVGDFSNDGTVSLYEAWDYAYTTTINQDPLLYTNMIGSSSFPFTNIRENNNRLIIGKEIYGDILIIESGVKKKIKFHKKYGEIKEIVLERGLYTVETIKDTTKLGKTIRLDDNKIAEIDSFDEFNVIIDLSKGKKLHTLDASIGLTLPVSKSGEFLNTGPSTALTYYYQIPYDNFIFGIGTSLGFSYATTIEKYSSQYKLFTLPWSIIMRASIGIGIINLFGEAGPGMTLSIQQYDDLTIQTKKGINFTMRGAIGGNIRITNHMQITVKCDYVCIFYSDYPYNTFIPVIQLGFYK